MGCRRERGDGDGRGRRGLRLCARAAYGAQGARWALGAFPLSAWALQEDVTDHCGSRDDHRATRGVAWRTNVIDTGTVTSARSAQRPA